MVKTLCVLALTGLVPGSPAPALADEPLPLSACSTLVAREPLKTQPPFVHGVLVLDGAFVAPEAATRSTVECWVGSVSSPTFRPLTFRASAGGRVVPTVGADVATWPDVFGPYESCLRAEWDGPAGRGEWWYDDDPAIPGVQCAPVDE